MQMLRYCTDVVHNLKAVSHLINSLQFDVPDRNVKIQPQLQLVYQLETYIQLRQSKQRTASRDCYRVIVKAITMIHRQTRGSP